MDIYAILWVDTGICIRTMLVYIESTLLRLLHFLICLYVELRIEFHAAICCPYRSFIKHYCGFWKHKFM